MKKFWKKTSLFLVTAAMTVSAPLMAWALEHDIVVLHTKQQQLWLVLLQTLCVLQQAMKAAWVQWAALLA